MRRFASTRRLLLVVIVGAMTMWGGDALGQTSGTDSNSPLLYTGLLGNRFVNVHQIGQASKGPSSRLIDGIGDFGVFGDIVVDQQQNVYVVVGGGHVLVYPRGGLVPSFRYDFPDFVTQGFAVDPGGLAVGQDGTLYAALFEPPVVAEYQKGNPNQASLVIPVPQEPCGASGTCTPFAVAVDGSNNVYIEYGLPHHGLPAFLEKCAPGSTQCTQLGITLGGSSNHLAVDSQGNLMACDSSVPQIDILPPGSTKPRVISQGLLRCDFFALNQAETRLYVANDTPFSNQGIAVFDYASGALVDTITAGIPAGDVIFGVAVSPAAQ
jgi:hypothetical protein